MSLYAQMNIFKRLTDRLVIYRCFKKIDEELYFIQSADSIYKDHDESKTAFFDKQLMQLFLEEPLEAKTKGYGTIEEAVRRWDEDFADEWWIALPHVL